MVVEGVPIQRTKPDRITLRRFDDMHCHFRAGDMLATVLPFTAKNCSRAIAMPNTRPRAVLTAEDAIGYRDEIKRQTPADVEFEPLMTIEIRDNTTPKMISDARRAGVVAGKVYPRGVTTNSDEGLGDCFFVSYEMREVLRAMRDEGMLLLLHGEYDEKRTIVTEREAKFLPILNSLAEEYADLKIVLEHVSSKDAVELVKSLPYNIAATITAHHLYLTLNDVIGRGVRPHNACMPIPKTYEDRDALIRAAISGNSKFFLGSDSAPHAQTSKENACGAYGVFTAHTLPELLAQKFDEYGGLDKLENFTSRFGATFYGLPLNEGTITLTRKEQRVPETLHGIVPFKAGETLEWSLDV